MKTKKDIIIVNSDPNELESFLRNFERTEKGPTIMALQGINGGIGRRIREKFGDFVELKQELDLKQILNIKPVLFITDSENAELVNKIKNCGIQTVWSLQLDITEANGNPEFFYEVLKKVLIKEKLEKEAKLNENATEVFFENLAAYIYKGDGNIYTLNMKTGKLSTYADEDVLVSIEDEEFLEDMFSDEN